MLPFACVCVCINVCACVLVSLRVLVSVLVRVRVCSGPAARDEAGVQAHVSDVVAVQQPGEEPLQAQAVPPMGTGAVLPLETHTHTH